MRVADQIEEIPELDGAFCPRLIERLVGHQGAIDAVREAVAGGRMPHGWLLTGPRGVGKASFAYLLARAIFNNEPLDQFGVAKPSGTARLIVNEAHPDLFVLRRRFNQETEKFQTIIPVADVRQMKDAFSMTAAMGGWRICILDAIDEMNANGVNALLKVLEEPPPKSLFLIVCHNEGRVLATIRSRCRHLNFSHLSAPELAEVLAGLYPSHNGDERAAAAYLAEGSAGMAVRLVEHDGLAIYREMVAVLGGLPRADIDAVHGLAARFTNRAVDTDRFVLFSFLLRGWLYRLIRSKSRGESVSPVFDGEEALIARFVADLALEPVITLWEKIGADVVTVEEYNLERKNTVLNWLETAGEVLGIN